MAERLRILLADDNSAILEAAEGILEHDFQIVCAIKDSRSIVPKVSELKPDVVVLDISMDELNGFDIAHQLKVSRCSSKIIFLTVHEELEFIRSAFDAGVSGYVFKSRMNTDLRAAIRTVQAGGVFIPHAPIPQ
jgi:DNA-binding NarL/FixJ family response regulator